MSAPPCFVGIDVAKAPLDIALRPMGERWAVANDDVGIAALVERLQALQPTLIVLEATGGYQRAVVAALAATGLPVVVVNPRQARDFAKATGQLAKTDALDARALAHVAEAVRPTPRGPCLTPRPTNSAPSWRGGGHWSPCGRPNRTASDVPLHGSSRIFRPISPGSTPGWRRWTTTSTRHGGRVQCGGSARSCCVASLGLVRSVPAHCCSTCRSWAR